MADQSESGIFPEQITTEILMRLPAKSIFRFKCVSKPWNSIIANPVFISSYISRTPLSWFIVDRMLPLKSELNGKPTEFESQQPPKTSTLSVFHNEFAELPVFKHPAVLISFSNGFFLVAVMFRKEKDPISPDLRYLSLKALDANLFLVNSMTNEWVPVMKSPKSFSGQTGVVLITQVGKTGVLERFMIVDYQPTIGTDFASLMCFSSETCKWEFKTSNYMIGMHLWRDGGGGAFEFDGHLVWYDVGVGLIAWDHPFSREKKVKCRLIELPKQCVRLSDYKRLDNERCIDVGGGWIQYLEVYKKGNGGLSLWRLKDYEGGKWSLMAKLSFSDFRSVDSYLANGLKKTLPTPFLIHPFKAHIAFFRLGSCIFSVNIPSRKVESCDRYSAYMRSSSLTSVVLPNWPISFTPCLHATFLKEQGNFYFMFKQYDDAIDFYSKSIELSKNALAYANRAMAYLKVKRYHEAEVDCTKALELDAKYFKAYWRRAIARKEVGNYEGYAEDLECALKLKPDDQELKKEHAEVKILLEKVKLSQPGAKSSTCSK